MLTQRMPHKRTPGKQVRAFLVDHLDRSGGANIVRAATEKFGISRQAVNRHLQNLVQAKVIATEGDARHRTYRLSPILNWGKNYSLPLMEHEVWHNDLAPLFTELPDNIQNIWHYGISEMLNNASDHSSGTEVRVLLSRTATSTAFWVIDNGVGIFAKIQRALSLSDERQAVLELAKGKLTTDPANHSGEGIFFSSRVFDQFFINSGATAFSHRWEDPQGWILERSPDAQGTSVYMSLRNDTKRTTKEVFAEYAGKDLTFTKTVVPVKLAQYGNEQLVSRSQAKRLLARVDRFQTVILDFTGVEGIGQAFADEVFRVFPGHHPETQIVAIKAAPEVEAMITRAQRTVVS